MAGKGGKRPGAGRPKLADELRSAEIAKGALIKKYGTMEAAIEALIDSKEPSLIKFVYEHAMGKAPDKIDHSFTGPLTLRIVRGKSNTQRTSPGAD